jgi:hypothetical protein
VGLVRRYDGHYYIDTWTTTGVDDTLEDGLESAPYVSDDFQIEPNGAYEHTNEHEIISKKYKIIINE